jgi:multicomponent Na+:H+ antiporter subunit D
MFIAPVLLIFIPIFAAILLYLVKNEKFSNIVFVAQASMIVLFVFYVLFLRDNPQHALLVLGGNEELVRISFFNDQTSLTFIGLTLIIWQVTLLYTFKMNKEENKFLFFLMFLQGVFLGLIQTNDLFNLFVFLELGAVLVTILITYRKTGPSFRAGIYYLLLNTIGAMMFLIGIIMIYYAYGTINIQAIRGVIGTHSDTNTIKLAYVFMLSGISVKAALFPVFTWLPKAHGVAQSTISGLLSGLIVKGAIYMYIRINNEMYLGSGYETAELFFWIGMITAIIGVVFALSQKDLKQLLAYSTISQVGIIIMGLTAVTGLSFYGGFIHIFNHAFFKTLLFLCAGVIIKTYGTKKIPEIRGLIKTMPWLSALIIVAVLGVTGAPFFNGFISKTLVKYHFADDPLKMILFQIVNLGTLIYFTKFATMLFGKKQQHTVEKDIKQYLGMSLLAGLILAVGIGYQYFGNLFYGVDLSYVNLLNPMHYVEYFIYVIIAFLIYHYVVEKDPPPIKVLRGINITFESANYLFVVYLLTIALFVIFL